jgi:N-acetylglucosaminyldiphosphoundecaprenol N-acetyl-beta-D-mannosaminyltransferase
VVWAKRLLSGGRLKKIAGADLFRYEMERMEQNSGKVFFLGSSNQTLNAISERAAREYPNVRLGLYSPPYKMEFTAEDNQTMIAVVNAFEPDVLFIGMTAPKQEKWAYKHFNQLKAGHVCCIGAVFDFYAGTVKRAPKIFIKLGLEWFYRLLVEPKRMWKRYLIGNVKFIGYVIKEKIGL